MRLASTGLIFCWLTSVALAGASSEELVAIQAMDEGYPAARDALVHDVTLDSDALDQLAQSQDWRVSLMVASIEGWRLYPVDYQEAMTLPPIRTRAGFYRFPASDKLHDVRFFPVFAERLLHVETEPGIRAALAELLARSDSDWAPVVLQALAEEPDAKARSMMLSVLRHGPLGHAERGFAAHAGDPDAGVREIIALQCGWLSTSQVARVLVRRLLGDESPDVRMAAARSAGVLRMSDSGDALITLLGDSSPGVRLSALRAIDRAGLDARPHALSMVEDHDEKVRRAAIRIVESSVP